METDLRVSHSTVLSMKLYSEPWTLAFKLQRNAVLDYHIEQY